MSGDATVLVVDDDDACRDLHSVWLSDRYDVLEAQDGSEALDLADGADVVLLDREMPGTNGTEVARRISRRELDCYVVFVSGVDPDFDIVDMPIDEYLMKPVTRQEVLEVVETMLDRSRRQDLHREFYSLAARKATLELQKSSSELADSDEYRRLTEDLEATRAEIESILADLDGEWRRALFWTLGEDGDTAEGVTGT